MHEGLDRELFAAFVLHRLSRINCQDMLKGPPRFTTIFKHDAVYIFALFIGLRSFDSLDLQLNKR